MQAAEDDKGDKNHSEYWREPLDKDKIKIPRGRIFIIPERCKQCDFCIEFCPRDVLEESKEINTKGYHYPKIKEGAESKCVNCEFCLLICPEFAIYTEEIKDATDEENEEKDKSKEEDK
jgi:2-oxoglutarate ferredoxin oxidoreductase subunit delta